MTSPPPEVLHEPSFALGEPDFEWLRAEASTRDDVTAFLLRVQQWVDAEVSALGPLAHGLSPIVDMDVASGRLLIRLAPVHPVQRIGASVDVEIDAVGVSAYLVVPTGPKGTADLDARNFYAALSDAARAASLMNDLDALPDVFVMGARGKFVTVGRDPEPRRVQKALEDAELRAVPFLLGCAFPRATVIELRDELADALDTVFMALLPLLHKVVWSSENDWLPATTQTRSRARAAAARARRKGPPREAERRRSILESMALEGDASTETTPPAAAELEQPVRAPLLTKRPRLHATSSTRGLRSLVSADRVDPSLPLAVGAKVRAATGAFEGKVGVVLELDESHARVSFGPLTARCLNEDLGVVAPPRTQPPLASSHRRTRT